MLQRSEMEETLLCGDMIKQLLFVMLRKKLLLTTGQAISTENRGQPSKFTQPTKNSAAYQVQSETKLPAIAKRKKLLSTTGQPTMY